MTNDESVDRVLEAWLAEGPREAPPAVAEGLSRRITIVRQRPVWRVAGLAGRTSLALAWASAATIAAIILAGLALTLTLRSMPPVQVAAPSPTPAASTAPSATSDLPQRAPTNPDRQPCLEGYAGCLGPLAAGTHTATRFGVGFDVPAGWTNAVDTPDWMLLRPVDATPLTWVALLRDAVVSGQDAACTPQPRPELGDTVDELVAFVTGHPGLVTSEPVGVTIGGHPGTRVDVSLKSAWGQRCPFNGAPTVLYLTQDRADPGWFWVTDASEHQRLAFLDDGAGGVIVVVVNAPTAVEFDALLRASDPIVASLDFEPGDPSNTTPGSSR